VIARGGSAPPFFTAERHSSSALASAAVKQCEGGRCTLWAMKVVH
jgi:hypothetical protein